MKKIITSKDEITHLPLVGEGNEATVYKLNDNKVIKLYHTAKPLLENKIIKLIGMQALIKNTHLPIGTVYIEGSFIACIHVYHKNSVNFESLKDSLDHPYRIDKFRKLNNNIEELIQNNIYYDDLDHENVLITPNNKVELIDTDSVSISSSTSKNNKRKLLIYNQLKSMIIECLFNEEYYFNEVEVLKNYRIKDQYIDQIVSENVSSQFYNDFFDYLEKDKVLELK